MLRLLFASWSVVHASCIKIASKLGTMQGLDSFYLQVETQSVVHCSTEGLLHQSRWLESLVDLWRIPLSVVHPTMSIHATAVVVSYYKRVRSTGRQTKLVGARFNTLLHYNAATPRSRYLLSFTMCRHPLCLRFAFFYPPAIKIFPASQES